nr:MAG TPA: hypothetical protein [Caudoviricetes sp.]
MVLPSPYSLAHANICPTTILVFDNIAVIVLIYRLVFGQVKNRTSARYNAVAACMRVLAHLHNIPIHNVVVNLVEPNCHKVKVKRVSLAAPNVVPTMLDNLADKTCFSCLTVVRHFLALSFGFLSLIK